MNETNSLTINNINNKKNVINRRHLLFPYKKSESVDKSNKVKNEIIKKNDSKKIMKRRSLMLRDKSESAIVNLLNSNKKQRQHIKEKMNTGKKNCKINFLFEN